MAYTMEGAFENLLLSSSSGHHASEPQPTGNGKKVLDEVLKDLTLRAETGKEKYGTYLRTNNGRDALVDLYQELLDGCMYLKQKLMEEDQKKGETMWVFCHRIKCPQAGKDAGCMDRGCEAYMCNQQLEKREEI